MKGSHQLKCKLSVEKNMAGCRSSSRSKAAAHSPKENSRVELKSSSSTYGKTLKGWPIGVTLRATTKSPYPPLKIETTKRQNMFY